MMATGNMYLASTLKALNNMMAARQRVNHVTSFLLYTHIIENDDRAHLNVLEDFEKT